MHGNTLLVAALSLTACNLYSHALPDAAIVDAVDAPHVTTEITIAGTVTRDDDPGTPVAGMLVAAKQLDDDSLAGSSLTTSNGTFQIVVQTPQGVADVYLMAVGSGFVDTYYDFRTELVTDNDVTIDAFTPAAYAALYSAADVAAAPTDGTMRVRSRTYDGMPIAGATAHTFSGSGTVVYDSGSGQPDPNATSTSFDGLAYVLNATTDVVFVQPVDYQELESREARVFPGAMTELELTTGPGGD
ncbi:MAG TPA: hypothetical protein VGL61_19320 [Kofleriaceae bacterium]|jgi:hypothetical protein